MRDPPAQSRDHALTAHRDPVRVLLVEDDPLDRMALERHVLRHRLPYELITAESGMDALQKLRTRGFDVVLLDYMLGDMTGLELLPELRGTPAIFVTGMGNEEIAASAVKLGAYGYLVKDGQGTHLNMLPVVISNVLERKRAEDSLREAQRRMAALLGNVAGMAYRCAVGRERLLQSASGGCLELTGFTAAELVDAGPQALASLVAPEDRARVTAALDAAGRTGRPLDCTYRLRTRAGGWKWVRDRATAVRAEDGAFAALEGFLTDITPQAAAEDAVRLAMGESEEAIRVRDRLVGLVVHDLRAPLSTLMLSVQQLRMELTSFAAAHNIPEGTEPRIRFAALFDGMSDRAADMLRMIDQLLLGSRLRSGKLVPALRPVSGARLRAMAGSMAALAQQKGIKLVCEPPESFRLLVDPDLLAEVVQNLLTNAIKFTRPGGTITVEPLSGPQAGFLIRDTGVGMAADQVPRLFLQDSTLTTVGTAGERGTGMGLLICKDIVAAHGGRIEVRSTEGSGSEFRVLLPDALPRLLGVALQAEEADVARGVVEGLHGELMLAAAEDEALELASQRIPQAVLVDGDAPSALRLLRGLRADAALHGVTVLWLGPALAPAGSVPDELLARPLDSGALHAALRLPFGG